MKRTGSYKIIRIESDHFFVIQLTQMYWNFKLQVSINLKSMLLSIVTFEVFFFLRATCQVLFSYITMFFSIQVMSLPLVQWIRDIWIVVGK